MNNWTGIGEWGSKSLTLKSAQRVLTLRYSRRMIQLYNDLSSQLHARNIQGDDDVLNILETGVTRDMCKAVRCIVTDFKLPYNLVFEPPVTAAIGAASAVAGAARTKLCCKYPVINACVLATNILTENVVGDQSKSQIPTPGRGIQERRFPSCFTLHSEGDI